LPTLTLNKLEKLHGKLQFVSIALPVGRPLLGELDVILAELRNSKRNKYKVDQRLKYVLGDWIILLCLLASRPTHVKELIQQKKASYEGWVDASYWGVGGVWFPAEEELEPFVWFVQWPDEIQQRLISDDNPNGSISISDLELAGILLEFLVLKDALPIGLLKHKSINI